MSSKKVSAKLRYFATRAESDPARQWEATADPSLKVESEFGARARALLAIQLREHYGPSVAIEFEYAVAKGTHVALLEEQPSSTRAAAWRATLLGHPDVTATSHSTKSVRTALTDRLRKRFGADATLNAYDVILAPEAHERLIAYLIDRHAWERLSKTVPLTRDSLIRDFGARGLMNAETAACLELQANFVSQLAKRGTDETEVVATKTGVTSSSKR